MSAGGEYLRAGAIARLLGISERTVRRWIDNGILPSTKIGGARLVARAALERRLSGPPDAVVEPDSGDE